MQTIGRIAIELPDEKGKSKNNLHVLQKPLIIEKMYHTILEFRNVQLVTYITREKQSAITKF